MNEVHVVLFNSGATPSAILAFEAGRVKPKVKLLQKPPAPFQVLRRIRHTVKGKLAWVTTKQKVSLTGVSPDSWGFPVNSKVALVLLCQIQLVHSSVILQL